MKMNVKVADEKKSVFMSALNPIKEGMRVRVRRGTKIFSVRDPKKEVIAKRDFDVHVTQVTNGTRAWEGKGFMDKFNRLQLELRLISFSRIQWVGAGGAMKEADVEDILLSNPGFLH
jgi:hypothetical protein